jgi:hypothetical protein
MSGQAPKLARDAAQPGGTCGAIRFVLYRSDLRRDEAVTPAQAVGRQEARNRS